MKPLVLAVVALTAALAAAPVQGQAKEMTTTADSVYSREQAERGQDTYAGYCRSCHAAETHTGAAFEAAWNGKSLAQLFGLVREKMPKNEPGSLSDQEYADVVAYLLQMNHMPAGPRELPADSVPLKSIRIQLKP